jgi:hypothetical protein
MANEQRSKPNPTQIQKFLGGMNYPAGKDAVLKHAKGQNAPEDVIQVLEKLPDREFEGPTGIIKELY